MTIGHAGCRPASGWRPLPGGFSDAICAPLDQFAAAIDDADVGGDITAARATSRAFANVAAAAEDTWTLQLRAVGYSVAT